MPARSWRELGNNNLRRGFGFEIVLGIGEANDTVVLPDIDPFWSGSRGIEGYAERSAEAVRVHRVSGELSVRAGPQDADAARGAFRNEKIAIGRNADETRPFEALGKKRGI